MTAHRRCPMPSRPGVIGRPGWCKWCDSEILNPATGKPHRQRMWHPDCADEHQLYTRAEVAREFLIGRDGDRCRECGAEDRGRWIAGPVVRVLSLSWQSRWGLDLWERPEGLSVGDYRPGGRFEFLGDQQDIQRATALQVDHVKPLWSIELTGDWRADRHWWSPANLQLLCPDCHKRKTALEAVQRARARRPRLTGYQHRLI